MDTDHTTADPSYCFVPDSYFDLAHSVCRLLLDYVHVVCRLQCRARCTAERDPYFVVVAAVVATCSYFVCHLVVVPDGSGLGEPGDSGVWVDHSLNCFWVVAAYFASTFRCLSYFALDEAHIWPGAHYWYCSYSCFVALVNA